MSEAASEHPQERAAFRPKERVIRRLAAAGVTDPEIAWRFRSSPGHIERIRHLTELPRPAPRPTAASTPTAIERTVLKARRQGATHSEIAARLRRTPGFVARVERFAAMRP